MFNNQTSKSSIMLALALGVLSSGCAMQSPAGANKMVGVQAAAMQLDAVGADRNVQNMTGGSSMCGCQNNGGTATKSSKGSKASKGSKGSKASKGSKTKASKNTKSSKGSKHSKKSKTHKK